MGTAVDEDFRSFVVARWPDLEAVARLVLLDDDRARAATTDALAGLSRRWREAVEDGRPGEEARRAVLAGAVDAAHPGRGRRAGRRGRPSPGSPVAHAKPSDGLAGMDADDGDPDDRLRAVLLGVLAAADPLDRALVAALHVWDAGPGEVAHLLELPVAALQGRDAALQERLRRAHAAALAAEGAGAPGWFERDLEDALVSVLRGQQDPPDPAGLVAVRSGTVQRRHLLLAGAAAVAVAGAGAAVALQEDPPPEPAGPKPPPGPNDPSWRRTVTWTARGPLATDPHALELVTSGGPFGSRVLWAGDVGTRRLVIASYPGQVDMDGTELVVWSGARGQALRSLQQADLVLSGLYGVDDLVAVALADGPVDAATSLLVVLTPPTTRSFEHSRFLMPTTAGTAEREWTSVDLDGGVAALVLDSPLGPALRVRLAGIEQAPAGMQAPFAGLEERELSGPGLVEGAASLVSQVTRVPVEQLRGTVVVDEVLDTPAFAGTSSGTRSRVVLVHTRLPNGAVLATAAVGDVDAEGESVGDGGPMVIRAAGVMPSERVADPVVARVEDERPGLGRFVVIAPGAARVQLISTSPDGYPVSKVVRTGGRDVSVVPVVNADMGAQMRVIARDARGRTLFDDVPYEPMWLLGL